MRCVGFRSSIFALILLFTLGACSAPLPDPTATPAPVSTHAAATALPSAAPERSAVPTVQLLVPTVCADLHGKIEDTVIAAPLLDDPLPVRVYTPPCFDAHNEHYPVLYLLHGQSYSAAQWEELGADKAADTLISSGQARPFLIVMPDEELDLIDTRESPYGQALIESLVPWVDQTYPTCPEAACRAIGGISRGAGWAVHLTLRHADVFSAAGAHSLAVFTGEAARLSDRLADIPPDRYPRFYLDSGRHDRYLESAVEFEQALNRFGVPHEWYLFEGIHDDAYWAAHIEEYMRWYAGVLAEDN